MHIDGLPLIFWRRRTARSIFPWPAPYFYVDPLRIEMGKEVAALVRSPPSSSPSLPKRAPPVPKFPLLKPFSPHPLPPSPDQRLGFSGPRSTAQSPSHVDLGDPAAPPVEIDRAAKPAVTAPYSADSTPTGRKQGNGGAGRARR